MLRTLMMATGIALTLGAGVNAALAADAANGEKWANRVCKACHTFDKDGKDMVGPNLWGVIGRVPGTKESFKDRYQAVPLFVDNGIDVWNEENVTEYVADPEAFRAKYAGGHESAMVVSLPPKYAPDVAAYLATLHD